MRFFAAVILATFPTSLAAQSDPYADAAVAVYQRDYQDFLQTIRVLYYALGCKVLFYEAQATAYIEVQKGDLIEERIKAGLPETNNAYNSLIDAAKKAKDLGLQKSQGMEACAYWRENPEQVEFIRELANSAIE